MGKIVIRITPHTYPRNKDIEQLIAYISGHGNIINKKSIIVMLMVSVPVTKRLPIR